jgi:hypothetical protein
MLPIDVLIDKAHGRLVSGELTHGVTAPFVSRLNANVTSANSGTAAPHW